VFFLSCSRSRSLTHHYAMTAPLSSSPSRRILSSHTMSRCSKWHTAIAVSWIMLALLLLCSAPRCVSAHGGGTHHESEELDPFGDVVHELPNQGSYPSIHPSSHDRT